MEWIIRPAERTDREALIEIALKSKGFWGYAQELMDQWVQEGVLDVQPIDDGEVWAAQSDGRLCGWCRIITRREPAFLEDLWVLPEFMRRGIGRALFEQACRQARLCGARALELDSDPHSVQFYERVGCTVIGETFTSWKRKIPRMRLELEES